MRKKNMTKSKREWGRLKRRGVKREEKEEKKQKGRREKTRE
jgi:hypothetical protein